MNPVRRRGLVGVLLVAGALTFGACSGDDGASVTEDRKPAPTTTTAVGSSDSSALCATFDDLVASGAGPGAQFEASTAEGWAQRIDTNEKIVDAAPPGWKDEAETYLQMVKDRAELAAEHGYVGVDDLPADVRNAFISSHREMQAQVNRLIAHMGSECGADAPSSSSPDRGE
jgi:hypothetical protein